MHLRNLGRRKTQKQNQRETERNWNGGDKNVNNFATLPWKGWLSIVGVPQGCVAGTPGRETCQGVYCLFFHISVSLNHVSFIPYSSTSIHEMSAVVWSTLHQRQQTCKRVPERLVKPAKLVFLGVHRNASGGTMTLSEICILWRRKHNHICWRRKSNRVKLHLSFIIPVSYTHLTLPTKLEV